MNDAEGESCPNNRLGEVSEVAEEDADVTADETEGEAMETDDVGDDVNSDGVHAQPDERLSPTAEIPDFNYLNEDGQEDCGITASDEDVGGGPEELDYRELKGPNEAQCEAYCAAGQ
jgi:hypothetical protein